MWHYFANIFQWCNLRFRETWWWNHNFWTKWELVMNFQRVLLIPLIADNIVRTEGEERRNLVLTPLYWRSMRTEGEEELARESDGHHELWECHLTVKMVMASFSECPPSWRNMLRCYRPQPRVMIPHLSLRFSDGGARGGPHLVFFSSLYAVGSF
jgi:hypothetical protein